tara:strand:+ start:314 stop:1651 length:1338 start_codon:yes stop_codon:yes gene_type:complete
MKDENKMTIKNTSNQQTDCFDEKSRNDGAIINSSLRGVARKETKQSVSLLPKLRFKEFEEEWEKVELGKTCTVKTGGSDTQDKVNNGKYPFFVRSNTVERINTFSFDGEAILTSGDGVGVGRNFHYVNEKFDFHQRVYALHTFKKGYYGKFIHQVFVEKFYKRVMRLSAKNSVDSVRMSMITEMKMGFPKLPEQQKIATFLTSVDTKIQQLTTKKQYLENYKKGAMQQLFSQQLRFKNEDGLDFPDWEYIKVQQLIDKKAIIGLLDGNHGELYPKSEEFTAGGIPYVAANNLVNGLVNFIDCKRLPLKRASKFKKGIAKNGDVLFAHNATVGPTAILKTDLDFVILSTTVTYYRCNDDILLNSYLLHYFNSDDFIRQYTRVMSQSTRNQVPITMQKKFKVIFPSLKEQQKIATYLSAIDEKITNVENQITKTQAFKKGLLQQLFV